MKTFSILIAAGFACLSPASAAEPQKPQLTLTAKRQLLDSEHDLRGRQGSSGQKTVTLRVEIVNVTSSTIEGGELSGDALITRAKNEKEQIVKESLGQLKLPAMKPNEKITLDLGKIQLSEVEWRNRKFEETLEEWRITCTSGKSEIGKTMSNGYEKLEEKVTSAAPHKKLTPPTDDTFRRRFRRDK